MKLGKLSASVFSCILLSFGLCLYALNEMISDLIRDGIVDVVVDHMVASSLDSVLPDGMDSSFLDQAKGELAGVLSNEIKDQIQGVKQEMMESDKLQEMSSDYIDALLDELIEGNAQWPNVSADINELAQEYVPKLADTLGVEIAQERITQISQGIGEYLDSNDLLHELSQGIGVRLDDTQKDALRFIRLFHNGSLQWLAIVSMIVGSVLLYLALRNVLKWLCWGGITLIGNGVMFMAIAKLIPWFWQMSSDPQIEGIYHVGEAVMARLFTAGLMLIGVGFCMVIGYRVTKFLRDQLNHR
ncbi:MAG: hypothetical protein HFE67_08435 [Erysipelotrichaceae bacterium]|nr:hypothetical protein [Erysipelotrichaceae bacterium]